YDTQSPLAKLLAEGYQEVIQDLKHKKINFQEHTEEEILAEFERLPPKSLIILVQSLSLRMTKHRLRADLFQQGHQVIEHARVSYNTDAEIQNYINSLQYDTPFYVAMGDKIEKLLSQKVPIIYESGKGLMLTIDSAYEKCIKNSGDFTQQRSGSSGFPIGEIFTEAKELNKINGSILVFAFPTMEHRTFWAEPFTVTIQDGFLVSHTGPAEFEEILTMIKSEEEGGKVQVREIGFGLNRALGFDHRISEPTSFERFAGVHFSLGLKHAMYRKKMDKKVLQKYHIDIFCKVEKITMGETTVFEKGVYIE
ncbi:MAG: hypothetical protein Q7K45_04275, partial [Nanoarchaeota archaeon]|nr:hypothetical protein [Nanoarchaeota archaeon]